MSSLLDQLGTTYPNPQGTVAAVVEHATSGWIDDAFSAARDELGNVKGSEGVLIAQTGIFALNKLEANKAKLEKLGYPKTLAFLGRVAIGQNEQAASILVAYGGGRGAWGSADEAVASAGDKTEQAKRDQDAAVAFAKEIGSTVAKAALPLLMAAVF